MHVKCRPSGADSQEIVAFIMSLKARLGANVIMCKTRISVGVRN